MYLKNIVIKNIGPITDLFIDMPFNEIWNPKPIIFVGENWSWKTILQSQIIDWLYEIWSNLFDDVWISNWLSRSYYKVSWWINLQTWKELGFSMLSFLDNGNEKTEYFDKTWEVKKEDFTNFINDFILNPNWQKNNQKEITSIDEIRKEKLQKEWISWVHFYQPAYRYEEPFWKNEVFSEQSRFEDKKRFSWILNKELEIITSTKNNKSFLMDLVLDFSNNPSNSIDQITWQNINNILRKIKRKNNIRFWIGPRWWYRVSIGEIDNNNKWIKELLPSIDNLSLWESILLNLFVNIIRHWDNPPKTTGQIQWIIAIDEIDVHLHTDLQNSVLPELIKMFPKIQFIITTHSPLFLLWMKRLFWEENFEIRNMPNWELITTERFSEFENAYKVLKETEKFEEDIKVEIVTKTKPIVYVEWPTDVEYIKKAYELHSRTIESFDIEIIWVKTSSWTRNSNNKALWNAEKFLNTNLNLLKQKVILLNDPEEDVQDKDYWEFLYIRKVPKIDETPLQKWIENFFEKDFIDKVEKKYPNNFSYLMKWLIKKNYKIDENKQEICTWICHNWTKEDFKNFEKIFKIIDDILI